MNIPQLCEIAMLCAFGFSWPFNIAKALRSKTARGKSIGFELLVIFGYTVGLIGKLYTYRTTTPSGTGWRITQSKSYFCRFFSLYKGGAKLSAACGRYSEAEHGQNKEKPNKVQVSTMFCPWVKAAEKEKLKKKKRLCTMT